MNITEEEKCKAQRVLNKCKDSEKERDLKPVRMRNNVWVMMPRKSSKKEIEAKKQKYNKK